MNKINVKDKIIEVSKMLDELDDFKDNISSNLQSYDYKLSDLYHKLEGMMLNSKNCYRFCKELKKVLNERREYKNNLAVFNEYEKSINKMLNGINNRKIFLASICKEDKKVRNSEYHNRIYTEEELKELLGV